MRKSITVFICLIFLLGLFSGFYPVSAASSVSWAVEPTLDYEDVEYFENGTYVFTENGKKGLVNSEGKILIDAKYDDFFRCSCGVVFTDTERKNALTLADDYTVSLESEATAHPDYYGFYAYFNDKIVIVSVGDRTTAKTASETDGALTFEQVSLVPDKKKGGYDSSKIGRSGIFGYRTSGGTVVFDGTLESAVGFENGIAAIKKDGKWAYIDENGNALTDFVYSDTKVPNRLHDTASVYLISEGFIPACRDGKWGWLDKNGKEVVACEYEKTTPVYGSRAWVNQDGKWGILDLSKVALPVEHLTLLGFLSDSGLYVGKSLSIRYVVDPASAEIFWKSSDENIVTVSTDGTAYFVSVGKATVSACDADGNILETLDVEVKERPVATENGVSKESLNRLFFILFAVFAVIGLLCAGTFIFARSRKISANAESEEQPISNDSETEKDAESAEKEE